MVVEEVVAGQLVLAVEQLLAVFAAEQLLVVLDDSSDSVEVDAWEQVAASSAFEAELESQEASSSFECFEGQQAEVVVDSFQHWALR